MTILIIFSMLGISVLAVSFKNIKSSEASIISLSAVIIILYVFSIFGLLNFGVYFVLGLGLAAYPITLILNRKNLKAFFKELLEPGFVVFIFFAIMLYFICKPIVTGAWDEYSHWALVVRNMLFTGALPKPEGAVLYITYPPASTLFQYAFMKIAGGPEGMMYYAQAILIAASVSALLKGTSLKKTLVLVMAFVLPVLVIIKFSVHNIFNIFPDSLMAIMAAAAFVIYYKSERKLIDIYKILPILFALCLVRPNAVQFAVFVMLMILVVNISNKSVKKNISHLLLPIVTAIVSLGSWQIHLTSIGAQTLRISVSLFPIDTSRLITILDKFKSAIFFQKLGTVYQPFYLASSTFAFVFMAVIAAFLVHILLKNNKLRRKQVLAINLGFFVCFIVYCLTLIFGYQFLFTKGEGESLASFTRFMGTFFIFWIPSVFYVIIDLSRDEKLFGKKNKNLLTALGMAMVIAIAALTHPSTLNIMGGRRVENVYQEEARYCAEEIQKDVGTQAKVYMIFQKSRGYVFMGTRYQLGTNLTNLGTWSLGKPYSAADTWTVDISPTDFLQRLYDLNYEYVYVADGGDAQLWEAYGMLFDKPDKGYNIFQVTNDTTAPLKALN